ncbi:MAG: hypothetical protein IIT86_06155, partial [Oscillospiraceae bacterium]|nr:hypothetical protein [Oscillospiraceae bacterium]
GNFSEEKVISFDIVYEVKAGDEVLFVISPEDNDAWDGGRLSVTIAPDSEPEPEPERTNNTVLLDDFTGVQGENGWYYGSSSWDGSEFAELPYDEENSRYYNNGKPELKKDFVEPGNGRSAAYKWVAAQDGKIRVKGEYVKFANSDDRTADGTCFRIRLNMEQEHWFSAQGNFSEEKVISFDIVYEVKAGDEVLFVISPEDNDAWDGGRLSVTISPESEP